MFADQPLYHLWSGELSYSIGWWCWHSTGNCSIMSGSSLSMSNKWRRFSVINFNYGAKQIPTLPSNWVRQLTRLKIKWLICKHDTKQFNSSKGTRRSVELCLDAKKRVLLINVVHRTFPNKRQTHRRKSVRNYLLEVLSPSQLFNQHEKCLFSESRFDWWKVSRSPLHHKSQMSPLSHWVASYLQRISICRTLIFSN